MIQISETTLEEIENNVAEIESRITEGYSISEQKSKELQNKLSDGEIEKYISVLVNAENKNRLDLTDLTDLEDSLLKLTLRVKVLREDIELDEFFSKGNLFDLEELERRYKQKKLKNRFPKFDFEKFKFYVKNPLLLVKNFKGEEIEYDPFVVKKWMIALIQMIFDEMDIFIANIGKEGSGKSCLSSQEILWLYTILTELGLIDYAYDFKKMFFSSIISLLNEYNIQDKNDFFRIFVLDEGNDLQRSNFREQENRDYHFDMRSSRKNLRIQIINIQQIGELDISLSLSRINFIFDCRMSNDTKTGTLNKGKVKMYIVPRGDFIYSEKYKKNISQSEIVSAFSSRLDKKKDYYVSLPTDMIIHEFSFEEKWGFDKEKYDEYIKNENRRKILDKKSNITVEEEYILFDKLPEVKYWGTIDMKNEIDKRKYWRIKKLEQRLYVKFAQNPELARRCEVVFHSKKDDAEEENDDTLIPQLAEDKPKTFYFDANTGK